VANDSADVTSSGRSFQGHLPMTALSVARRRSVCLSYIRPVPFLEIGEPYTRNFKFDRDIIGADSVCVEPRDVHTSLEYSDHGGRLGGWSLILI